MDFIELKTYVVNKMIEKKITISTCESATAGAIASSICDISGASNILKEAYVTYSNEAKEKILKIDKSLIEKFGVVSSEIALIMAINLYNITNAKICISVTGNLGPRVLENKKAGLVYIGFLVNKNYKYFYECNFEGDRLSVKRQVIEKVFYLLKDIIENHKFV